MEQIPYDSYEANRLAYINMLDKKLREISLIADDSPVIREMRHSLENHHAFTITQLRFHLIWMLSRMISARTYLRKCPDYLHNALFQLLELLTSDTFEEEL